MKNFRKVCRGEKGFTLIELLVVIVILGILAAVVTLAITSFIGKGNVEAAKTELAAARAAIAAAQADGITGGCPQFNAIVVWNGSDDATDPTITCAAGGGPYIASYYLSSGGGAGFKGLYTVDRDGNITLGASNLWGSKVSWSGTLQTWIKTPPAAP